METKACCHVANGFLSTLELIWCISSLKISRMSKKCIFGKKLWELNYGLNATGTEILHVLYYVFKLQPYPDNFANREILNSNVHCKLKRTDGCPWKGPLQDLEVNKSSRPEFYVKYRK